MNEQVRTFAGCGSRLCSCGVVSHVANNQVLGLVQVENVCSALANMTELRDGYNGVGFSQGVPLPLFCELLKPETRTLRESKT